MNEAEWCLFQVCNYNRVGFVLSFAAQVPGAAPGPFVPKRPLEPYEDDAAVRKTKFPRKGKQ